LLVACAGQEAPQTGADSQLFARGLKQISDLYIRPVSDRELAVAGMARLSRLDNNVAVGNTFGNGTLTVAYAGRDIAFFATPPDNDSQQWGSLVHRVVATAKQASPKLAALPQESIDTAVFSGISSALDRFSHYSAPELARDQRADRDGFGSV